MIGVREALKQVTSGKSLSLDETHHVMSEIMSGNVSPVHIAGLLVALSMKGETAEEIAGAAMAMRHHATRVVCKRADLIDTCGTGGDGLHTFNVSTVSAFVAAGAGVAVAKHGNRAMSGHYGSADLLEGLGVRIDVPPEKVAECIDTIGIGFLFAMQLHPAMKHAGPVRRELGVRTAFNVLGPLTNPAGARRQLVGVYDPSRVTFLARVLDLLGCERAMVVHGDCGLDEVSISAPTMISELVDGRIHEYAVTPEDLGLHRAGIETIQVDDPEQSLRMANEVLDGRHGAPRDIVLMNAAAAILIAGAAENLADGVEQARRAIDSGAARDKVDALVRATTGAS